MASSSSGPANTESILAWDAARVLQWASSIHLSLATVALFRERRLTGKDAVALDRATMASLGINALDISRILGHVHVALSTPPSTTETTKDKDSGASAVAVADDDDVEGEIGTRRQTVSYSTRNMPDSIRLLKSRVWDLFQHDVVASRTTRLFVEGDLVKYQPKRSTGQTRRFLLLDTCLLWCQVKSRGKSHETDTLALKGRLDRGVFSVIDLPDGTKHTSRKVRRRSPCSVRWYLYRGVMSCITPPHGSRAPLQRASLYMSVAHHLRQTLNNAFKIFNKDKEKWYTLVADNAKGKELWLEGFHDAGIPVERSTVFDASSPSSDLPRLIADLSNEDAKAIMGRVRDGTLDMEGAIRLAKAQSFNPSPLPGLVSAGSDDGSKQVNSRGSRAPVDSEGQGDVAVQVVRRPAKPTQATASRQSPRESMVGEADAAMA
eukprot:m.7905 g.7905  ORF g.7905 m.7905 type:complete len:434 (-) comp2486_c0_seq1:358-1659(-)